MTMSQETSMPAIVAPQVLLSNHLKALKLPTFAREYEKIAMESAQDRIDYPRYLLRLCELERIDRERRTVERRIRRARFPQTKSFDTFDFAAQPSLNKALVLELMRCEWIDRRQNCIALGPSGTGKTHTALDWDCPPAKRVTVSPSPPRPPSCTSSWKRATKAAYVLCKSTSIRSNS